MLIHNIICTQFICFKVVTLFSNFTWARNIDDMTVEEYKHIQHWRWVSFCYEMIIGQATFPMILDHAILDFDSKENFLIRLGQDTKIGQDTGYKILIFLETPSLKAYLCHWLSILSPLSFSQSSPRHFRFPLESSFQHSKLELLLDEWLVKQCMFGFRTASGT